MLRTIALTAALTLATGSGLLAQTTWIMATGYTEGSFFTQNIRQFIEEVETKSNGALKIDLRPADSLIKLDAIKRAVQSGQVPIGEIRMSAYGNEGAMYNLDNIPGVASNYDQAWKLMEAQKPYWDEAFGRNGMAIITYVPWPGQGFYTNKALTGVDDLKGLKLRIYSQQTRILGEKLGAEAIILPFAEVPQAFSTGMINALWTSAQSGTEIQAWDYVKDFTYTGTLHQKNAIIVNQRALRALDEATRQIVIDAGAAATARGWEMSKVAEKEKEQVLADHGMTIARAPASITEAIAEAGKGMVDEWLASADAPERAVYDAYIASIAQ